MSNDDSDLVILKGSANAPIGNLSAALSAGSDSQHVNIAYGANFGYTGSLQNFPTDLGAAASGAAAPIVGTSITGVTFDATMNPGDHYQGPVYMQIGLSD